MHGISKGIVLLLWGCGVAALMKQCKPTPRPKKKPTLGSVDRKLDHIITLLLESKQMAGDLKTSLDALETEITNESTIDQGIVTLLNGLSVLIAELKAGQTDPSLVARVDTLAATVRDRAAAMAAAAQANTQPA